MKDLGFGFFVLVVLGWLVWGFIEGGQCVCLVFVLDVDLFGLFKEKAKSHLPS